MANPKIWSDFDFITLILTLLLIGFGVVALAGATMENSTANLWIRQVAWVMMGLVCLFCVLLVDYQFWIRHALLVYLAGLVGLLLCFTPFLGHVSHGATSWIKIKGIPLQFQTSEFAKITTIIMLAKILSTKKEEWNGLLDILKPLSIAALPSLLIAKQPDTGTALVLIPITLVMMFVAGLPYPHLLLLISPALCLFGVSHDLLSLLLWVSLISFLLLLVVITKVPWTVWVPFLSLSVFAFVFVHEYGNVIWEHLPEHQKGRVLGYINPDFELNKTNYNINQSKIALGSGGFWGKGLGHGTQSKYQFLPELQHDFVFPVVGEQLGFWGGGTILGLFLLMFIRGIDTAMEARSLQGALLVSGVIGLFFTHLTVNVSMVSGLLPVTGLPLTFISYGGSFMLASMVGVGLIMNVRMWAAWEMLKDGFSAGRSQMSLPRKISDDF